MATQNHSLLAHTLVAARTTAMLTREEEEDRARLASAHEIFVVACTQSKRTGCESVDVAARTFYTGNAFGISARVLEENRRHWLILSGGYGFIQPQTRIRAYEQVIARPQDDPGWFDLARLAVIQHYPFLFSVPRLVILGSRRYATAAGAILASRPSVLPILETPVAGLPIGKMYKALASIK